MDIVEDVVVVVFVVVKGVEGVDNVENKNCSKLAWPAFAERRFKYQT